MSAPLRFRSSLHREWLWNDLVEEEREQKRKRMSAHSSFYIYQVSGHQPKRVSQAVYMNHFFLHCVPKERSVITPLSLRQLLRLSVLLRQLARSSSITPRVLTTQVQRHEDTEHQTHRLEADQDGVTGRKPRRISRAIDVSSNRTSDISESDVHRHADTALSGAADVVAVPRDALGHVRVDAAGDEEDADVLDGVVLATDEHDEADEAAGLVSMRLAEGGP